MRLIVLCWLGVYPVAATVARVDYCWRYEHAIWQIFRLFLWLSYIHFFFYLSYFLCNSYFFLIIVQNYLFKLVRNPPPHAIIVKSDGQHVPCRCRCRYRQTTNIYRRYQPRHHQAISSISTTNHHITLLLNTPITASTPTVNSTPLSNTNLHVTRLLNTSLRYHQKTQWFLRYRTTY